MKSRRLRIAELLLGNPRDGVIERYILTYGQKVAAVKNPVFGSAFGTLTTTLRVGYDARHEKQTNYIGQPALWYACDGQFRNC